MDDNPSYAEPLSSFPPAAPEPPQAPGSGATAPPSGPPRDQDMNGPVKSRGGSRRRKPVGSSGSSSQMHPTAFDTQAASHGRPISYQEPYSNGHLTAKTFADRARDLAEEGTPLPSGNTPEPVAYDQMYDRQQRYSRAEPPTDDRHRSTLQDQARMPFAPDPEEAYYRSSADNRQSARLEPMIQVDGPPVEGRPLKTGPERSTSNRDSANPQKVDWAVDHSPLQKLENDLLTKEKKRARVQKAEQKIREKEQARKQRESQLRESAIPADATGVPRDVPPPANHQSAVPAAQDYNAPSKDPFTTPQRSSSNRRSMSDSQTSNLRTPENRASRIPRPVEGLATYGVAQSIGRATGNRARASLDYSEPPLSSDKPQPLTPRRKSVDDRGVRFPQDPVETSVSASRPGPNEPPRNVPGQQPALPAATAPRQSALVTSSRAAPVIAAGKEANLAHEQVSHNGQPGAPGQHHGLFSHLRHGHEQHDAKGPVMDAVPFQTEWRQGATARLLVSDMTARPPSEPEDKDVAWWESPDSGRKRGSSVRQELQQEIGYFDGAKGDMNQPTKFDPPLYMKCGPLLRYTGTKQEKSDPTSNTAVVDKVTWRGSVMIVTVDSSSDYSKPPTLRLFHQHMDLLPPPPAQINEGEDALPSEYVDPVAGLPKIARDGSTVYVKPAEDFDEGHDYSKYETDEGLYESSRTAVVPTGYGRPDDEVGTGPGNQNQGPMNRRARSTGRYREVKGVRLHAERGVTFWRFNLEVELGEKQSRVAYRINKGASTGFWVPGRGDTMNIMFHSCNGFSSSVNPDDFSGPDPLWRDVLNTHQTKPFHVMIGGGDQIYNDKVTNATTLFNQWLNIKNPLHKRHADFTPQLRDELEAFYLNSYSQWFSQGLFAMANSQIPMVNIWDDHDIIDGFGSYPHHFMSSPVFSGLGEVAFKYYMLFQHQSVPTELEADEPSWVLGAENGPYIKQQSRSVFMRMGRHVSFLGLDCRTERMREEVMSEHSYDRVFDRCRREIVNGETKHLLVLLGVPIAYPRLVWLENILTSRAMDPVKALGRLGVPGISNLMQKFDGGYEILDDLDDHWTASHHKDERRWFIQELQDLAAEKSIRITILGGDVHLGAVGQFFSNKKLGISKDQDHRYMPNVISSAIVNTPPPDIVVDILNKRDKIHHLDHETDENMIPMFLHDVDGKKRNNKKLLPRRNWCSICEYHPGSTPPPTPPLTPTPPETPLSQFSDGPAPRRSLSLTRDLRPGNLIRRLSLSNKRRESASADSDSPDLPGDDPAKESYFPPTSGNAKLFNRIQRNVSAPPIATRPLGHFHRRPTDLSEKAVRKGGADVGGEISLENGLDIRLNFEIKKGDPLGSTEPYRLLVPALYYTGIEPAPHKPRRMSMIQRINSLKSAPFSRRANADSTASFASRDGPVGPDGALAPGRASMSYPVRLAPPADSAASQESLGKRPRRQSLVQRFGSLRGKIPQFGKSKREGDETFTQGTNDEYSPNDDAAMMRPSRQSMPSRPPISMDNVNQRGRRPSFTERIGSIGRRLSQMGRPKQEEYHSEDEYDDDYTEDETESEIDNEEDYIGSGDLTRPGRQPMTSTTANRPTAMQQQQRQSSVPNRAIPKYPDETPDPFKARPLVAMSPPPQAQSTVTAATTTASQPEHVTAHTGSTDAMVGNRQALAANTRTGRIPPQDNRRSGGVFVQPSEDDSDEDYEDMDSIDDLDSLKQVPHKKNMNKILGREAPPPPVAAPAAGPNRKDMSKFFGTDDLPGESAGRKSLGDNRRSRGYDGIDAYNTGKKKWWQL